VKAAQPGGLLVLLGLLAAAPAGAQEQEQEWGLLAASVHADLAELGETSGAVLDIGLQATWLAWPQVGLGLEAQLLTALRSGNNDERALTLQLVPTCTFRFGEPSSWGYVKLGTGYAWQMGESAWVLAGTAGYAVAPRELYVFFGFELFGEITLIGAPIRTIGLGGLIGFVL